jgi:hypothetical protein
MLANHNTGLDRVLWLKRHRYFKPAMQQQKLFALHIFLNYYITTYLFRHPKTEQISYFIESSDLKT